VNDAAGTFELVGGNQLRVKNSSLLDFEARQSLQFVVNASDGKGGNTPTTIAITITDIQDVPRPPGAVSPTSFTIPENSAVGTVVGTVQATDPDGDTVTYSLSNDATGTFEIANGNQLRVKINSLLDFESRQTLLTVVQASDGKGGTSSTTVTVTITGENEPPVKLVQLPARDVFEDATALDISLAGLFLDPEDSTDPKDSGLTFTASSGDATIVETSIVGNVLSLSFKLDASTGAGSPVNVVLSASDNTNTTSQTFAVTVRPVNDKPTVSVREQITIPEDSGPQEVAGFIISTSPGPANESSQQVSSSVTNFTVDLFTADGKPRIENGRLLYTPAPNAFGESVLTIRARDDGGTANGGVDTSADDSGHSLSTAHSPVTCFADRHVFVAFVAVHHHAANDEPG
jgi:VCBS repeat-containing protein